MKQIAVVIPTRNRGSAPAEAAHAVLRDGSDFELVVVDQSDDGRSTEPLSALLHDRRFRFVSSGLRGISNARNTGVALTTAPIIAFTDDDCRPEPNWVSSLARVFREDPEAKMVFGRVRLPEGSHDAGYAAQFVPTERVLEGGVPLPNANFGVGANFAIRRDLLDRLGGFDPLLGTGAPFFKAGEETDVLVRALHAGCRIVNADECDVLHLGVRTGADIRKLAVGYQISTGAAFGKHARLDGVAGIRDAVRWAAFYARGIASDLRERRRPRPGVLCYFVVGAALTFRYRLDRSHGVFKVR
jgi:GT2 family glycosyltransferase